MPVVLRLRIGLTSASIATAFLLFVVLALPNQGWTQGATPIGSPPMAESLTIAFHRDDGSLTPYSFEYGHSLMTLVYDTLMWRDKEGNAQPWLATLLEPSEDFTRFTVKLADATWHDGRPVTSSDVAFSFRLFQNRSHPRFTTQVEAIEAVDTPDPATVVFRLRAPRPGFADLPLADVPIVPMHVWSQFARSGRPRGEVIGSGPYRLTNYAPGEGYRFEAFQGYFRGTPKVGVLQVVVIDTTEERLQAIERRRIDMTPAIFPASAASRVRGLGTSIIEGPAYAPTLLILNTRKPPFDDPRARQAVSKAIDVGRIRTAIGRADSAASGLIHPESVWAPPSGVHEFAPDEARSAFRSLRLPKIEILAPTNDLVQLEAGKQVALALERAGADAQVVRTREVDLVSAIGKTGQEPTFTAAIWTSPNLTSYEPSFIDALFGTLDVRSPFAFSGFSGPELDELIRRSSSLVSIDERKEAVTQMLTYLDDSAPVIPLAFSNGVYAYRSTFSGWVYVKGSGILDKRSFVEPESSRAAPSPETGSSPRRSSGMSPIRVIAVALSLIALGVIAIEVRRRLDSGKPSK